MVFLTAIWVRATAQEIEPRRWSHLPVGSSFLGAGYLLTNGDIAFDPVLRLDGVTLDMDTLAGKFLYNFALLNKSARFDLIQGYQDATWEGLLDGAPASATRNGWSDTAFRFSMNLVGAPPLAGKEFAAYRAGLDRETILGLGLVVVLPTGDYLPDKLLNLGDNRFSFRPQIGMVHEWNKWSFEFTGSTWFFTDNEDFFGGNRLAVDPFVTLQAHLVHTFSPGLWISCGVGHEFGAQSTLNGIEKDDRKSYDSWGVTLGVPIDRKLGLKFGYIATRTREKVGGDLGHVVLAASRMW